MHSVYFCLNIMLVYLVSRWTLWLVAEFCIQKVVMNSELSVSLHFTFFWAVFNKWWWNMLNTPPALRVSEHRISYDRLWKYVIWLHGNSNHLKPLYSCWKLASNIIAGFRLMQTATSIVRTDSDVAVALGSMCELHLNVFRNMTCLHLYNSYKWRGRHMKGLFTFIFQ